MRIHDLSEEANGVSASITFEAVERRDTVWFRGDRVEAGFEPFVAAYFLVAMASGEPRLAVDGAVDPSLTSGLATAGAHARHWWGWRQPPIEAAASAARREEGRAASFFTGGIDSLFTLHRSLRTFADDHPWRPRRALLAYGFDSALGADYGSAKERATFDRIARHFAGYLDRYGIELETLDSNFRSHFDYATFHDHLHGGGLAAFAHASGPGVYRVPSTHDVAALRPFGSHPDLEGNMSSASTRIIHDGHDVERLRKLALLSAWSVDLSVLHVCFDTPGSGLLNCGRCQKCRRTIIEIAAVGLDDVMAVSFPGIDAEEVIATFQPRSPTDIACVKAAATEFHRRGQPRVALERRLRERAAVERRVAEQDWRGPPKRLLRRLGWRRQR